MQTNTDTNDLPIEFYAAMFRALGRETRLSRSGYSITFAHDTLGRRDLSSNEEMAAAQLHAAGIELDSITDADVQAYRAWYEPLHESRRIGQARFLITRKFAMERGDELVPCNRVSLIDGWGELVASVNLMCREHYDPDAINRIGGRGAVCSSPDYPHIQARIDEMRQEHPEFVEAPVVDNNLVR